MKIEEIDIWYRDIGLVNKIILRCFSKKTHIARLIHPIFRFCLNIELPKNINGLRLPHPYNIAINPKTIIDSNVTIYHNVSIGSSTFGKNKGVPKIEKNIIIYPQSIIVENVIIGQNYVIGAGSIVVKDIPPYSIVAGNPAKVISSFE